MRPTNHTLKLFVGGSRNWVSPRLIRQVLVEYVRDNTEVVVVHGGAKGVDNMAGEIAKSLGFTVRFYPAEAEGRKWPEAGVIRNSVMLQREHPYIDETYFDEALLFHEDPNLGKGTRDMHTKLLKANPPIPVRIFIDKGTK